MPFEIQPIHILIIIVVALLIFGPGKLPDIGRNLGKAISEFRQGAKGITEGFRDEMDQPVPARTAGQTAQTSLVPNPAPQTAAKPGHPLHLQTPSMSPKMRFCIQCGTPNVAAAHFCNNCGIKLPE